MEHEQIKEQLTLFYENISAGFTLTHWVYEPNGNLLESNSEHVVALQRFLETTGCLAYALEYGKQHTLPILLGAPLGLMWGAAFEYQKDELFRVHVLGPCFHTSMSQESIKKLAAEQNIPLSFRRGFIDLMTGIPVISSPVMTRILLMLHHAITKETLSTEDVANQSLRLKSDDNALSKVAAQIEAEQKDRQVTYMTEQSLLAAVRNGVIDEKALSSANNVSSGVPVTGKDPSMQARISVILFISLCTRAAIEGGLSPDKSYSVGDYYIQLAMDAASIPDLGEISDEMYREFISLVHECRQKDDISAVIRSCCDYIELHAEEELPLDYLAKRSGYAEYYLSRKFKSEVGASISEYINEKRVDRAKVLLVSTTKDIQSIGEQLHFGSRSYFALTFKKYAGMSPSDYRKEHQKK